MKKALLGLLLLILVGCLMANVLVMAEENKQTPLSTGAASSVGGILIPIDKASLLTSCIDSGAG